MVFFHSPVQYKLRKGAKVSGSNGYLCAICKKINQRVVIDHISPVILPEKGFESWDKYIERLFCDESNLQVCCRECHKNKTREESKLRKFHGTGTSSAYSRQLMSDIRKGKKNTPAQIAVKKIIRERLRRPLLATHIESGKEILFPSVTDASKILGVPLYNISRVCNGMQNRSQAGGYKFKYVDKQSNAFPN